MRQNWNHGKIQPDFLHSLIDIWTCSLDNFLEHISYHSEDISIDPQWGFSISSQRIKTLDLSGERFDTDFCIGKCASEKNMLDLKFINFLTDTMNVVSPVLVSCVIEICNDFCVKERLLRDTRVCQPTSTAIKVRDKQQSKEERQRRLSTNQFNIYVDIELDVVDAYVWIISNAWIREEKRTNERDKSAKAKTKQHLKYRSSICLDICNTRLLLSPSSPPLQLPLLMLDDEERWFCVMTTSIFTNYIRICKHRSSRVYRIWYLSGWCVHVSWQYFTIFAQTHAKPAVRALRPKWLNWKLILVSAFFLFSSL